MDRQATAEERSSTAAPPPPQREAQPKVPSREGAEDSSSSLAPASALAGGAQDDDCDGGGDDDDDNINGNSHKDFWKPNRQLPDFKDQMRGSGPESGAASSCGAVAQGASAVAVADEDPEQDPPTLPAEVMQTYSPSGNAVAVTVSPPPPESAASNSSSTQEIVLRKHMIWAGALVLTAVVIAVTVSVTRPFSSNATTTAANPPTIMAAPAPSNPDKITAAPPTFGNQSPPTNGETESPTEEIQLTAKPATKPPETNPPTTQPPSEEIKLPTEPPPATEPPTEEIESPTTKSPTQGEFNLPTQQTKLLASDGAAGDSFGWSVAIDGDTIVIGAHLDDTANGEDSGSAYVYTRSSGTGTAWTQQSKLTISDGAGNDEFGTSVAIDGDTIVIGARHDDDNGISSGSAYVYVYSGTVWSEQMKLTASDGIGDEEFGGSVSIVGDTIVIGASQDYTDNGFSGGSAYVYTRSRTVWTEQAILLASDGAANDDFGWSVAIDGDTIVIGAPSDESSTDSGSAYVYNRSGTVWTEQAKLTASDGAAGDEFGTSVAIAGDTIVIGAAEDDMDNDEDSGSAYVYTLAGTVWSEQAMLLARNGKAGAHFGTSVAINGDTIVLGAHWDDDENGVRSGSAYVYTRSSSTGTHWTEQIKLTANDSAELDYFGTSVAMDGGTIVIGAWLDDDNGDWSGSAYIFE